MKRSVFGLQRLQLMCLLQFDNCQFINFVNLEKGLKKKKKLFDNRDETSLLLQLQLS